MKINEPVTDNEIVMKDGQFIVSTTDRKGIIQSINRDFIEISGFSSDELIGRNHNLVRHPDMPPEAFEDLWCTIKADKPWIGIVKNRCKNGDFYWVKANVTPMRDHGHVTGYMSVRTKPTRQEIEQADTLYKKVRAGETSLKPSRVERVMRYLGNMGMSKYLTLLQVASVPAMAGIAWLARQGADLSTLAMVIGGTAVFFTLAIHALKQYTQRPVNQAIAAMQQIANGDYFQRVETHRDDELGRLLQNIQSAQIRLGYEVNEIRQQANSLSRVQEALGSVNANIMIADQDLNIIYLNKAVKEMMRNAEDDIRKELPEFDSSSLLGTNVDIFHKNPAHQRGMMERLQDSFTTEFELGGRSLRLTANPIINEQGERLGTVVEWLDRTSEVAVEREIQSIVDNALMGNLTERVSLEGKEGFFRSLSGGVNDLMQILEQVIDDTASVLGSLARGELDRTIDRDYEGSFARLKDDVNATIANLTRVIGSIRNSADAVENASQEIAEGNMDLARRTEMQASNLEETASSMEEITSTVRQNADNSGKASELASITLDQAVNGGSVVKNTITAMEKITDSSKKIAAIISVIDDIAFQTNLLALNAAVEAARAGEQGRGFAVVATEVRNLAQRSATAAKEIKELIEDSVNKVEEGSDLVDQSGKTLDEIVTSVKKVNDFIAEIAAASSEQYAGIDQVNQAVSQMDEVTQQNAALVEEAAQTSQMMDEQAKELGELISFFKTDGVSDNSWEQVERRSADRHWSEASQHSELDFATARTKHKLWKTRLRAFLDGDEAMREEEAVSHHACDLGKWLLREHGNMPRMRGLEKIHAEMHTLIKQVIQAKHSGDNRKAEPIYARVEKYSDQIAALLEQLEQETGASTAYSAPPAPARTNTQTRPKLQAVGADDVWDEF
ncbi:methyl-accepting chemotaxis protein [Thiolapillus sp.]|uniref:methyl-accepting chemotaxis protein n=1 Tax=Thiolapillus sp. TaxID=2017437 RepID=UPI0025E470D8|nr:methyl-accepting chemotaxis protein [Thiolapillus sp.]